MFQFFCAQCGQQFGEEGFHERDGKPYCKLQFLFSFFWKMFISTKNHYFNIIFFNNFVHLGRNDYFDMFAPKCAGCNRAIMENYISALNAQWHADCFVCRVCDFFAIFVSLNLFFLRQKMNSIRNYSLANWNSLNEFCCVRVQNIWFSIKMNTLTISTHISNVNAGL